MKSLYWCQYITFKIKKKINADGALPELRNQLGNKLLRLFYEFGLFKKFIIHFSCFCFKVNIRLFLFLAPRTFPYFPKVLKTNRQPGDRTFHCELLIWAAQFQERRVPTSTYLGRSTYKISSLGKDILHALISWMRWSQLQVMISRYFLRTYHHLNTYLFSQNLKLYNSCLVSVQETW